MRLSVIIPVYNTADYLPRCLDSLLCQDLSDCEILLVDDGSTDGRSGALCDDYARRDEAHIRVIHRENGGLGEARNTGIDAAEGDWLLFVDSDDYVSEELLSTLRPFLDRDLDAVIFPFLLDRDGKTEAAPDQGLPTGRPLSLPDTPELLLAPPNACNKLWRRSLFADGTIRFPGRIWYEDLATTPRLLARAGSVLYIDRPLYYYVLREGSITRNGNMKRNLEIITAVETAMDWFRAQGLYERYRKQFQTLTVRNVLLDASVRVIKMGERWDDGTLPQRLAVLEELRAFTDGAFPAWPRDPARRALSPGRRLVLTLLRLRRYRTIRRIFDL